MKANPPPGTEVIVEGKRYVTVGRAGYEEWLIQRETRRDSFAYEGYIWCRMQDGSVEGFHPDNVELPPYVSPFEEVVSEEALEKAIDFAEN